MNTTRIKVKTIGYYHRDRDMKVTLDLLPKEFNENRKYIENPNLKVPFVNLNITTPDSGAGELKMESLLEYIRQRPWTNENKPDFVTNKNLLKSITATEYKAIEIHVVRMSGVIFMLRSTNDSKIMSNIGPVFEHFLTGNSEDRKINADGIVRKAVFSARIPMNSDDSEKTFKVMYSGEIDAIDRSRNNQHYELKVFREGLSWYFWEKTSCKTYWQSVFGNVPTLVIGSRTGTNVNDSKTREPLNYPENSLYQIRKLGRNDIVLKVERAANNPKNKMYEGEPFPRKPKWTVENCEKKIQELLGIINENVKNDGDCFVFWKRNKGKNWNFIEDKQRVSPFQDIVFKSLNC